ncbi:MAG: phosphatidylglycerol lysyltransferase domain-containing protein [Methanobacteriota archaeon]
MLSLDDFHRVSLVDKPLFDAHYARFPPVHSDNLFTTMVSWSEYVEYRFVFVHDSLIIMTRQGERVLFRPPSGKSDRSILKQVLLLAKTSGSATPMVLIDAQAKTWMSSLFPSLVFVDDRDMFDYVYRAVDLAELSGTPYAKIRNRLNKFNKNYSYTVEDISRDNMAEISEFLKRWCLWKDCESDVVLENERKAILFSMKHFFVLGLSGIVLRINGVIEAISVFERMSPDTAVVHYEKGSPEYDGIYKAVNLEAAKRLQKEVLFVNRETDMGQPGLRQAKLSYHPHHMVEVFSIHEESLASIQ